MAAGRGGPSRQRSSEQAPPDAATARRRLRRAEEKPEVARQLAAIDVEVAYVTAYDAAYDAAPVAITAHMLATGLRVPARPRAHETVAIYGEAGISTPGVRECQRMRHRRIRADDGDVILGVADFSAPTPPISWPQSRRISGDTRRECRVTRCSPIPGRSGGCVEARSRRSTEPPNSSDGQIS